MILSLKSVRETLVWNMKQLDLANIVLFLIYFLQVQCDFVDIIHEHFSSNGLVVKCLEFAFKQEHIMDFTRMRALESLFSMIHQGVRNVLQYNQQHPDFPMEVRKCLCSDMPSYPHYIVKSVLTLSF